MYISQETPMQTEKRLLMVIAKADLKVLDAAYVFEEFAISEFAVKVKDTAVAFVRDENIWSQLVPARDETQELFKIVSLHFQDKIDNSGFVGWLASHLKHKLGTGVFVVCGQNSNRGGIFDYWGCPYAIEKQFVQEIQELIKKGREILPRKTNLF